MNRFFYCSVLLNAAFLPEDKDHLRAKRDETTHCQQFISIQHRMPIKYRFIGRQRGQSMTEYTVVCLVLALALGIGMVDENSVLWQLLEAFKTAYQKISFSLSLPL